MSVGATGPIRAYIGLGANLGAAVDQIECAIDALAGLPQTRVAQRSSLYRTLPWGPIAQDDFINAVAAVDTGLSATDLMRALLGIEQRLGRERGARFGPRRIDLDLLLYAARCIDEPQCCVPHPRMSERAFVLVPLAEIAAQAPIPGRGTVQQALAALPAADLAGVQKISAARAPCCAPSL